MSDSKSGGIGVVGAVQVAFVVNKLTSAGDIAGWSWWWVLSPIWLTASVALFFWIIGGVLMGIGDALDERKARKRREARLRAASAAGLRRR